MKSMSRRPSVTHSGPILHTSSSLLAERDSSMPLLPSQSYSTSAISPVRKNATQPEQATERTSAGETYRRESLSLTLIFPLFQVASTRHAHSHLPSSRESFSKDKDNAEIVLYIQMQLCVSSLQDWFEREHRSIDR
jgi:hypothetical protein